MRNTITHIATLWILSTNFGLAQCPGAQTCEISMANPICSVEELNGMSCSSNGSPSTLFPFNNLCFGTGTPTNLYWWTFIGSGGPLQFQINTDLTSCSKGNGIQAGVFEGSCERRNVWDCNADCLSGTFTLSGTTKKCEIYSLWIDGCDGDVCNFTMTVTGNTSAPQLPDPFPPIEVESEFCKEPDGVTLFCTDESALFECSSNFQWSVDGVNVNHGDSYCTYVLIDDLDPHQICLTVTIGNPNHPPSICDQKTTCITYQGQAREDVGPPRTLCTRATPFVWHGMPITQSCVNPPCTARTTSNSGCPVDSIVPFIILPPELHIGAKLVVPPSAQPFVWHGMPIDHSCIDPPCSLRIELPNGCLVDSLKQIEILRFNKNEAVIQGFVYSDINDNCDHETGEPPLEGIQITASSSTNSYQTLTNNQGFYSMVVPFEEYEVSALDLINRRFACPTSNTILVDFQDRIYAQDFYQANPNCYPGRLNLLPLSGRDRLRCDPRRRSITLEVSNSDENLLPQETVVLEADSLISFVNANVPFNIVSPTRIELNIPDISGAGKTTATIFFDSDCDDHNEEDVTCFTASYLAEYRCNGQLIQDQFCGKILNSRDPNDLTVTPHGFFDQRYIDRTDVLNGLIRFHNSGSDTAYDIRVELDLPLHKLNLEEIHLLESSADKIFLSVENNQLIFSLPNIRLPHNDVDSVNSHGYIAYSVTPVSTIPDWEVINQFANIFFDFNAPIPTNIETQTIAGTYIHRNEEVLACIGDSIGGRLVLGDTIFFDTLYQNGPDAIIQLIITALPTYEFELDTSILAGDEIRGVRIYSDTTIQFDFLSQDGCDSTYIYHVEATTTGSKDLESALTIYPNPVQSGKIFLSQLLPHVDAIDFIDEHGRVWTVPLLDGKEANVTHFKSGIYLYRLPLADGSFVTGKMVVR